MPALLMPADPAAGSPLPFEPGGPGGPSTPEPAPADFDLWEDAEAVLKSRVAMLREKLLQKRQGTQEAAGTAAAAAPEPQEPPPDGGGEAGSLVDHFLAEGSNRQALRALADEMARRVDKLGPPPEVDLPRAQLGDAMLDAFMSRSRASLEKKESVADADVATAPVDDGRPEERKAKRRRRRREREASPAADNVFLASQPSRPTDRRQRQPSEQAEANEASPTSEAAERSLDDGATPSDGDRPKKRKRRKDKHKKAKAKSDGSEDPKRSKQASKRSRRPVEEQAPGQHKDASAKKARKSKKATSRKEAKDESIDRSSSEERRGAAGRRKAEAHRARERHTEERSGRRSSSGRLGSRARRRSQRRRPASCSRRRRSRSRSRGRGRGRGRARSPSSSGGGGGGSGSGGSRRGRGRRRSSGSRASGGRPEGSDDEQPEEFRPYSRVVLHGLQVNTELNGLTGIVAPPGLPKSGDLAGTYKVRLETAREIAARPANLKPLRRELSPSRARRLGMVEERLRAGA